MSTINYNALSDSELLQLVRNENLVQIAKVAEGLAPEKIAYLTSALELDPTDDAVQRICTLFLGATTKEQVEALGKVLNTKYSLTVIQEAIKLDTSQLWKASSLLLGITHRVFVQLLRDAPNNVIHLIQHEALRENIQHHLTLYIHESEERIETMTNELLAVREQIAAMLSSETKTILFALTTLHTQFEGEIAALSRCLAIGWNTNRPDLVVRLSQLKEQCIRTNTVLIGSINPPTGCYLLLHEKIQALFSPLSDDEPAIEALAQLHILELSDFWDVGLLPEVALKQDLELDPTKYSDKECLAHREKLMNQLFHNLGNIQLNSVGDVKRAFIFSKENLADYVTTRTSSVKT